MKLNIHQVEATMTAAWGRQADVVPYRLAGNRYSYVVTDHDQQWLPLLTSWVGGRQVFEPVGGTWPELVPSPGSSTMTWDQAVLEAMQLAYAYFAGREDGEALKRLPRAQAIATRQNWHRLGDRLDTWLMPGASESGRVYLTNGRCTCPDFQGHGLGWWCKHRLARALARRAAELLRNGNGAGGEDSTPAPSSMKAAMNNGTDSTTTSPSGQARRIELVMAYEAEEANALPLTNANGQLVEFRADGQVAELPGAWQSPRPKTDHPFEPSASRVYWGLGWAIGRAWFCGGRPDSMFSLAYRSFAGGCWWWRPSGRLCPM